MTDTSKPAQAFLDMAERIDRNRPEDFAGAFLIVPPSGEPMSGIHIGPADLVAFLAFVKTKVELATTEALEKAQATQPWNRVR